MRRPGGVPISCFPYGHWPRTTHAHSRLQVPPLKTKHPNRLKTSVPHFHQENYPPGRESSTHAKVTEFWSPQFNFHKDPNTVQNYPTLKNQGKRTHFQEKRKSIELDSKFASRCWNLILQSLVFLLTFVYGVSKDLFFLPPSLFGQSIFPIVFMEKPHWSATHPMTINHFYLLLYSFITFMSFSPDCIGRGLWGGVSWHSYPVFSSQAHLLRCIIEYGTCWRPSCYLLSD